MYELEMVKTLIFSARPVVYFSGPARPIIKFFILGPFGPAKGFLINSICSHLTILVYKWRASRFYQFNR